MLRRKITINQAEMPRHDNSAFNGVPSNNYTNSSNNIGYVVSLQKGQPSWVHTVATLFDDDYDEIAYFRQFKKSPSEKVLI